MEYTLDEWLNLILPYPTLSNQFKICNLINDIARTNIPDIIHGIVSSGEITMSIQYLCYVNDDNKLMFNSSAEVIKVFINSIKIMTRQDLIIVDNRNELRQQFLSSISHIKK